MDIENIIQNGSVVVGKSPIISDTVMHYCPGCSHGVVHKLIAEVIDELGIQEKTIGIAPVGCAVFAYNYLDIDWAEAAHGRAPAVATGISRVSPEKYVFTYQGDGDLAAIGCGEIMHACGRGENIVIIYVNNAIYGMTGGQMSPTTLPNQITATTPSGRDAKQHGFPMKITEMLALLDGTCYVTRQCVDTVAAIRSAKKAIKKAFENTRKNSGISVVEILGTCSSGWKLSPVESNKWMRENLIPNYPLGDIKDIFANK